MIIRQRQIAYALTTLIAVVSAYTLFAVAGDISDRIDRAETEAISRDKAVAENQKALTDANAKVTALSDQVEGLGKEPVVSPLPVAVTGDRGPGPTLGQVAVAIQNYCIANGECRGITGLHGVDGAQGEGGPAGSDGQTGATGSTGTDGKDGANGKDGADGTNGSDGRGIASMSCADSGQWVITYSDATTETVEGPCRVPAEPAPAPAA